MVVRRPAGIARGRFHDARRIVLRCARRLRPQRRSCPCARRAEPHPACFPPTGRCCGWPSATRHGAGGFPPWRLHDSERRRRPAAEPSVPPQPGRGARDGERRLRRVHHPSAARSPAATGDRGSLHRANSILSTSRSATRVVGPTVAGVVVAGFGGGWAIAFDALSFAVAALCMARLTLATQLTDAPTRTTMLSTVREGWDQFRARSWVVVVVATFAGSNFALSSSSSNRTTTVVE